MIINESLIFYEKLIEDVKYMDVDRNNEYLACVFFGKDYKVHIFDLKKVFEVNRKYCKHKHYNKISKI
jgi:hypothetical protein